jgi:16S rRNA processing protein RimM
VKTHLEVGYVRAAHGLNGEVVVRTHDPASSVLDEVDRVWAHPRTGPDRELKIEDVRTAPKNDLLVAFEGVETRQHAEALVGATIAAFREDLEEPAVGEYFQGDLVGLEAVDPNGAPLGTVAEIWNSGPVPNLVIRGGPRGEIMVPFVDEFVPEVDMERRRVVVKPMELTE